MRTAVATVLYKNAYQYFDVLFDCLAEQTYKDFELLIIIDDLSEAEVDEVIKKLNLLGIKHNIKQGGLGTPAKLRVEMLSEAKKEYDFAILIDCDDKMSTNRVEEYIKQYDEKYDFFYNELFDFKGENVLGKLPQEILCPTEILECNFLGLSTTAINLNRISQELFSKIDTTVAVFDWLLYTTFLLQGLKGKLVENCSTIYRLYEGNIAGRVDKSELDKEVKVKRAHYAALMKDYPEYKKLYELYSNLMMDEVNIDKDNTYWWGNINVSNYTS